MPRAQRRTRRVWRLAAVALLVTLPATVFSLLHDERDDVLCNPALVAHDQSAHRFSAPQPASAEPEHCILCHALQSLRAAQTSERFSPPSIDAGAVARCSVPVVRTLVVFNRPARAPPLA